MSVEKNMQQGNTLQEKKPVSSKTSEPLRSEKKKWGGIKGKEKLDTKTNQSSDTPADKKFVPTCSICGQKHWPFHPLVPCVNIKKAKSKAKAERKARAKAEKKAKAEAKAKAKAEKKAVAKAEAEAKTEKNAREEAEKKARAYAQAKQEAENKAQSEAKFRAQAEEEARSQGRKGVATTGYYHNFWFMPASFFEANGFLKCGGSRQESYDPKSKAAVLWKVFDEHAEAPLLLKPRYEFKAIPGKVVIDLFWNEFCQTSNIEAQRVREVAAEFGDLVTLNQYSADDRASLLRHQIARGIFVNGREIYWGHEAPRDGIREAITHALRT